jgi:hypothetical protein
MDAKELPEGTGFYDVDGIPVAVLAWDHCLAFNLSDGHSYSFPYFSPSWETHSDRLTRQEFMDWLRDGFNKFDARFKK